MKGELKILLGKDGDSVETINCSACGALFIFFGSLLGDLSFTDLLDSLHILDTNFIVCKPCISILWLFFFTF
jgi:hypothetical protein